MPSTHPSNPAHVGFGAQQSLAWHVPVAQVTSAGASFKWLVPSTHAAKSVPLPSTSAHVGLASQHSLIRQTAVEHVVSPGESLRWFVPSTHPSNPAHVGLASQHSEAANACISTIFKEFDRALFTTRTKSAFRT